MPKSGPRTVHRYTLEFKLTAVRLSHQPGMQVKTVAAALEIHPVMLSKWRKDVRDGTLRGRARAGPPRGPMRELKQFQAPEKANADASALPLTPAQHAELTRRIADANAHPDDNVPWETVRDELFGRGG